MFMIMGWDNLVPSADGLIGGLFSELLRNSGFSGTCGINFHDVEIQFLSSFKEGSVLDHGSHSSNPYRVHWFPRCHSFGVDDHRGRECASHSVRVCVHCCEPWITEDEVIRSQVGDIEVEKMRSFSGDNFKFSKVFQTPSCIRGSVSVLQFLRVLHEVNSQSVFIDVLLTDEAFCSSTVKEGDMVGLFLSGV